MKSIKYIVVAGLLGLFSCQKEDIKPNRSGHCNGESFDDSSTSALFIQTDSKFDNFVKDRIATGADKDGSNDGGISTEGGTSTGDVIIDSNGGITDPNNEPDASKRKGKK